MIPILYEKTETAFISNGLGRLRDCITCVVTEERNGIYELDFDYPVTGQHFDEIQIGRIVAVEHDDSGDVQPFDIVSYSRPIEGVVTFHCTHISYRQSYLTVTGSNISSLANAFTRLKNYATPSNPFTYWTDKTSTGYVGAFDGVPKSVRSILGGVEGSILDAYGGEYEWDSFTVKLWSARGQYRDFAIRYGVNLLEYQDETDSSECYSSCIPYWTDGTTTVVGDKQTLSNLPPSGRDACIPMDVSEKFEDQPTKAQVNSTGLSMLNSGNPYLPAQNITVSFIRLQDTPEYEQYSSLLRCSLCDTIKVYFPDYGSSGDFKIVKTVWDVLGERYEEMELGDLSISLSQALGIQSGGGVQSGGGSQPESAVVGAVQMFAGSSAPSGWLMCNGQAVSRTTYAKLFSAIGTTYGTGDGSTTFNLPDLRDRFPVGAGTTYSLNAKGGAVTVTLGASQIPAHSHGMAHTHSHTHGFANSRVVPGLASGAGTWQRAKVTAGSTTTNYYLNLGNATASIYQVSATDSDATASSKSSTDNNTGGGGSHENRPPYIGINFIIYAGA